MEKDKLIKIITELKEVRTKTKSKVSDEMVFDCSIRIYNSEQIESHKSNRQSSPTQEKASKEQINLLYKLNADFNAETITKKEAWNLTNKLMKK